MHISKRDEIAVWKAWTIRLLAILAALIVNAFIIYAVVKLNADNSIELVKYGEWYWGDDVPELLDGSYDPATGTVALNMDFGAPFTVILTK